VQIRLFTSSRRHQDPFSAELPLLLRRRARPVWPPRSPAPCTSPRRPHPLLSLELASPASPAIAGARLSAGAGARLSAPRPPAFPFSYFPFFFSYFLFSFLSFPLFLPLLPFFLLSSLRFPFFLLWSARLALDRAGPLSSSARHPASPRSRSRPRRPPPPPLRAASGLQLGHASRHPGRTRVHRAAHASLHCCRLTRRITTEPSYHCCLAGPVK
jgi:hypothetical protein